MNCSLIITFCFYFLIRVGKAITLKNQLWWAFSPVDMRQRSVWQMQYMITIKYYFGVKFIHSHSAEIPYICINFVTNLSAFTRSCYVIVNKVTKVKMTWISANSHQDEVKVTNCFSIITWMIIRENKIIDQFPTPKIKKSGCHFENC